MDWSCHDCCSSVSDHNSVASPGDKGTDAPEEPLSDVSFTLPVAENEPSSEDARVAEDPLVNSGSIQYSVIERATQRGRPRLVDSAGYSYGIHRQMDDVVHWRCTTRNGNIKCQAKVRQDGTTFTASDHPHSHAAAETRAVLKAQVVRF